MCKFYKFYICAVVSVIIGELEKHSLSLPSSSKYSLCVKRENGTRMEDSEYLLDDDKE